MKVTSFMRTNSGLSPVEVELSLLAGLPQFQFIGLPDAALKESTLRIRAALREQGFQLPQAQSILVHLKPSHLRKSSRGLDLAIAAALLWETGQLPLPAETSPVLYGELTLKGEVVRPDDIDEILLEGEERVFTGPGKSTLQFALAETNWLKDLASPNFKDAEILQEQWIRPRPRITHLPADAAELAAIVASGEHSLLLAGPPGSGKSTLAEAIPCWIEEPQYSEDALQARRNWRQLKLPLSWRPVMRPHHSITPLAMIGGGSTLWPGEITRAHGGVLVMDELLEFDSSIQEALREPMETGAITLARAAKTATYPSRFLPLATTNLCDCGKFVPRPRGFNCRCAKAVRRKTLGRLTGPFTDRFEIFALTDLWGGQSQVSIESIQERARRAIEFRRDQRLQLMPNSRAPESVLRASLNDFQRTQFLDGVMRSRRRTHAILRIARTCADLREDLVISNSDLDRAIQLATETHGLLEEWQE